jgi:hypothetical protein
VGEAEIKSRLVAASLDHLAWILEQLYDGILQEGMSSAGAIEHKLGLKPGEYPQQLRAALMVYANSLETEAERQKQWKEGYEKQKAWLRGKLCKSCLEKVEKGF